MRRSQAQAHFNEPKLLKFSSSRWRLADESSTSALQRAEIAEIDESDLRRKRCERTSALQRAEIAEIAREAVAAGLDLRTHKRTSTSRNC